MKEDINMTFTLTGGIILAIGGFGPAIGIGLIGSKAVEAIGRNPEANNKILMAMLMGMALAEAIAIFAFILALSK